MTRVLVTGASGAVGANLAKALIEQGHEVTSILHDERPLTPARLLGIHDQIAWCRGNIIDETLVKRILADYDIELVYHLAALPIVKTGTRTTRPIFEANLIGTLSVLEAMKEATAAGFDLGLVYVSTDKVYGETEWGRSYLETDPLNAMAPYETSKACADMATRMFHRMGFIHNVAVLRPSNMYGPGDFNIRIVPNTIKLCLQGKNPWVYKGIPYVREYTYFEDFADAAIKVGDSIKDLHGDVFNIGSGFSTNQMGVISEILKHFPHTNLKIEEREPQKYVRIEIPYQTLDHNKFTTQFNWHARVPFQMGIYRTVAWWEKHPELWMERGMTYVD